MNATAAGLPPSLLASRLGVLGAALGFLGVAAGAFGAHALKGSLAPAMMDVYETAARYQIVHAVALVVVALALERRGTRPLAVAGVLFAIGIVLFSGSLFALALLSAPRWGLVTPFGGMCLLTGWACLGVGFAAKPPDS
jgi:uncharacterized membrane protein YgdD (TMEM256/DUF423 family)